MSQRSASYPAFSLDDSIELVKKIYSNYGDSLFVDRQSISAMLGVAEVTVRTRVSTASQYGLLEKKSKEGYKPTKLFVSINSPLDESEGKTAKIQSFKAPKLYEKMLSQFVGKVLPKKDALANYLHRECSIALNASGNAADTFIENAKSIGLLDDKHILRSSATDSNNSERGTEEEIDFKVGDLVFAVNHDDQVLNEFPFPISEISDDNKFVQIKELGNSYIDINSIRLDKEGRNNTPPPPVAPNILPPKTGTEELYGGFDKEYRKHEILLTNKKKAMLSIPVDINNKDIEIIKAQLGVVALAIDE